MVRYGLIGCAAAILVAASLVPDDAFARRGGGGGFRVGEDFTVCAPVVSMAAADFVWPEDLGLRIQ